MSAPKRLGSPFKERNENVKKSKMQMEEELKSDNVDEMCSEKEANYDFLFQQEDDFDLSAFEVAEKELNIPKLDLTQWQRCTVKEVERDSKTFALILNVQGKINSPTGGQKEAEVAEAKCYLQGPWCQTRVMADNVVSLKAVWDESLKAYKIDKDEGFCVTNPDTLISGTTVVGSLFCRRKAVLQDRFRGIDANNKVMVIGSLVHEILQVVLEKGVTKLSEIENIAYALLNSQETAFMLYSSKLTRDDCILEIKHFVSNIQQFVQQYLDEEENSSFPLQKENFQGRIIEIQDIEENLWIPQLGVKGKIDVSVKIHSNRRVNKFMTNQSKIVPLELKTGKASFSMEHKGQLILYQMMLNALGKPTESGLLLYLRENIMQEIQGTRNEQRGLIELRNDLSYYLSQFPELSKQPIELPEPISHHTACSQCAYATICCTFAKTDSSLELKLNHPLTKVSDECLRHLTAKDFEYFIKWCHLLMLEEQETRKSNYLNALWCHAPEKRIQMGRAICDLKIDELQPIEKQESRYKHQFIHDTKNKDIDLTLCGFSIGEYVIVSTEKRLAIAAGFILNLTTTTIMIDLERNLQQNYKEEKFIIDKYDSQSGNVFNFTNLGILLDDTEHSKMLRKIIIERQPPQSVTDIPQGMRSLLGCDIFHKLNNVQVRAAVKAIRTTTFRLIKGLPGTGKTECLVALIRALNKMGRSVLVTSHTHSAVDNLLLRLIKYNLPFIRLGSSARVNPELRTFSETVLTAHCKTEEELSKVYNSYPIVGVTCLGSAHAIFLHRRFDYCIVDEASQIMQPTILRPLFYCQRFVLVGDPDQLPPIIKSPLARQKGADESLFQLLDCDNATSALTLQYRMNKTITKLANKLTYGGVLKCGSKEVTEGVMCKPILGCEKERWLLRVLQSHIDQSVFFLDTLDCSERSYNYAKTKYSNTASLIETTFKEDSIPIDSLVESSTKSSKSLLKYTNYCEAALVFRIVKTLLNSLYEPERIGIIAPYRAQVELLKKLAIQYNHFYHDPSKENEVLFNFAAVEINTVDQYQGRDKDIIIYACSRTGPTLNQTVEHNRDAEILEDQRRLTVAITRSRHKLIIIGDSACIQQYTPFKSLLTHIPSLCKLKLEDNKLDFLWSDIMDELSQVIADK